MLFDAGDVVLVGFPFSSGSGVKQRPALVVLDSGDEDVLVARITTQSYTTRFDTILADWVSAGLLAPSTVRLHKLATVEKTLIRRKLGTLSLADWKLARAVLQRVWA